MHSGPREILLVRNAGFRRELSACQVEETINRLVAAIRSRHPEVKRIYVEARSESPSPR